MPDVEAGIDLQMETDKFRDPHFYGGTNEKAANDQVLLLAESLSWANMTSKETLRARLNKSPGKDTRVVESASK